MIKTQKVVKHVLIGFLTVCLALGGYYTYVKFPSFTDYELTQPPTERLGELMSFVDTEKPINPNLYAASTFQPDDPLYDAIIAIQEGRWHNAEELLNPLVEQGNADAMFWLADITYSSSAFSDGGKWFLKAAELGNPYAAIKLSPKYNISNDCNWWLKSFCDEKWGEVGLKTLKSRAKNGDIKAAYAYLFYTRFDRTNFDFFDQFLDVVSKGIQEKYYRPLRQLVFMYQTRRNLNPYNRETVPLTEQDKKYLMDLLMIAALDNDVVSINILASMYIDIIPSQILFDQIFKNNLNSMNRDYFPAVYDYFTREFKRNRDNRSILVRGYAYSISYDNYDGGPLHRLIYEDRLKENDISPLTEQEKAKAQPIYEQLQKDKKPVAYIDEVKGAWANTIDTTNGY